MTSYTAKLPEENRATATNNAQKIGEISVAVFRDIFADRQTHGH